jgi:hypothetical protein
MSYILFFTIVVGLLLGRRYGEREYERAILSTLPDDERKKKLIADLVEIVLGVDPDPKSKQQRDQLLRRAASELDSDAFYKAGPSKISLLVDGTPSESHRMVVEDTVQSVRAVLDGAITRLKA